MIEKLLLVVIVLQIGFWISHGLRERRFRRDMAKRMDRIAQAGIATTEKYAADLARHLAYIETQVEWVADRVSELRLEQMGEALDQEPQDPSVDHLKDYAIEPEDR